MKTHGDDELLRDLRDEADLCANEGVPELAGLLNAAADRLGQLLTIPAAPAQDEHQAFIDSLPTDSDDKMYMQIHHWARQSYKRHQSSVRGQMITAADASDTHIIWAALRWAKENTPPAQPAPVRREHVTDGSQCWCNPGIDYIDPDTGAAVIVHKEPQ